MTRDLYSLLGPITYMNLNHTKILNVSDSNIEIRTVLSRKTLIINFWGHSVPIKFGYKSFKSNLYGTPKNVRLQLKNKFLIFLSISQLASTIITRLTEGSAVTQTHHAKIHLCCNNTYDVLSY